MVQPHTARSLRRAAAVLSTAAATATAACAAPAARHPQPSAADVAPPGAVRAMVHLTAVGLEGTQHAGDSLASPILVYASGAARVGIAGGEPQALHDTLRLFRLAALAADVTDGEVHLELTGPGRLSVGGTVSGGPATRVAAKGRHLVLLRGGAGINPEE